MLRSIKPPDYPQIICRAEMSGVEGSHGITPAESEGESGSLLLPEA